MGMDFEACRRFMEGLANHPSSDQLERGFHGHLRRSRCTCRKAFSRPCPAAAKYARSIRGSSFSFCPACGSTWADHPDRLYRIVKDVEDEGDWQPIQEDEEDEDNGWSGEFRHVLSTFDYKDLFPPEFSKT
eukprot:6910148-Prymnesium_polylepis.1